MIVQNSHLPITFTFGSLISSPQTLRAVYAPAAQDLKFFGIIAIDEPTQLKYTLTGYTIKIKQWKIVYYSELIQLWEIMKGGQLKLM